MPLQVLIDLLTGNPALVNVPKAVTPPTGTGGWLSLGFTNFDT